MSTLTTESQEVWVVIRRDFLGNETEITEYSQEDEALLRAHEEVRWYVEKTKCYASCRIEHRVVPIYK